MSKRARLSDYLARIEVDSCGDQVDGLWCDSCALPSASALVVVIWHGARRAAVPALAARCHDCGREALA